VGQSPTSMSRYIALLRAINVGGHVVKMEDLRRHFADLGFANVATFIASGNVIFDTRETEAAALERRIERHLRDALGYEVATFLRTPAELAAVAQYQPFPDGDDIGEGALFVAFLPRPPAAEARQKVAALDTPTDSFHVHERELYWLCRTRLSDSRVSGGLLEKTLGLPATMRNVTTVRRLAAKYPPTGEG
jgi:uncharacterized protein (DUF1697 family)